MTPLGGGVMPLSPSDRFASGGVFNLAAIIRRIIRVVCVRGVTDGLRQHSGDGPMKNRALAMILVAAAFGSACCLPAAAQNAVGGMKKQNSIGGPAKPNSIG